MFGTGLGSAYYMWRAHLTGNVEIIAATSRHVVTADWLFTTPSVIVQPLTGAGLLHVMGMPWDADWVILSFVLYAIAGLCWLPVVWIQMKVRNMAQLAQQNGTDLPPLYYRYMKIWFTLGWPAFLALIAVVVLMVSKPITLY